MILKGNHLIVFQMACKHIQFEINEINIGVLRVTDLDYATIT